MHDLSQRVYALMGNDRHYTEAEIENATLSLQNRLSAYDVSFHNLLKAFDDPDHPVSALELAILKIKAEQAHKDGDNALSRPLSIALAYCVSISDQNSILPNGKVFIDKTGFIIDNEETYKHKKNIIHSLNRNDYVLILYEEGKPLVPLLEEMQIPYIFFREVQEKNYIFKCLISNDLMVQGSTGRYIVERIGFLIHMAEMFNHYKNVIYHFNRNDYVLILYEEAKTLVPLLEEMQVPFIFLREVQEKGYSFKYLVSNHVMGRGKTGNWIIQEIGIKNIRFMYALGKSQWNYSDWNSVYDLILCFGPYQVNQLSFCKDTKKLQIGYPRYDGFFNEKIDKNYWLGKFNCDLTKKTIVWLPTTGTLSSVKTFYSSIANLKGQYNIVVKPHPLSLTADADAVGLLKKQGFNAVIDELIDNSYLFYIADYIFSDYGGTAFGAIYTDRNLVLLNVANAEDDSLTGIDSADIALRQSIINIDPENSNKLPAILSDPQIWEVQKQVRNQLRSTYFAPYYGNGAEITANILKYLDPILNYQEDSTLLEQGPIVQMLMREVVKCNQEVKEMMMHTNEMELHLNEIQNSRAWRLVQFFRRLKNLVLLQRIKIR